MNATTHSRPDLPDTGAMIRFAETLAASRADGRSCVCRHQDGDLTSILAAVANGGVAVVEGHKGVVAVRRSMGPWLLIERPLVGRRWVWGRLLRKELGTGMRPMIVIGERYSAGSLSHAGTDTRPTPLRRTLQLLALEREDIGVVLVYGIALGLLSLAVPIAVQSLVNTVAFGSLLQPLIVLTLLLAVALLGGAYLHALQYRVVEMLQRRVFVRVVAELAERLPRLEADAFRGAHGPELLNRFFDVFTAQKAISSLLLGGLDAVLIAFVGMTVLAFYHPALLAFDIGLIVAAVLVFMVFGRRGIASSVRESRAKYAVASWLEEMARHTLSLKLAGGAHFAMQRTEALATDYLQERHQHFRVVFRQLIGALGMQVIASVALLAIGGMLVIERQLSLGQLVAAELIVTAVVASIAKLGSKVEVYYDLLAAVDKLGQLLDLGTERSQGETLADEAARTPLRLHDLSLDALRLPPLNLELKRGEVALLSGFPDLERKALAEALYGLRELEGGRISLGGRDLRDLSLTSWRQGVALVGREGVLSCSIMANLRSANPELSLDAVWSLLELVGLAKTVRALPDGLDTRLRFSGAPLDQAQALRLTLARALVCAPGMLVLDRALDCLDAEARLQTLQALKTRGGVGVMVFSEDPGLLNLADIHVAYAPQEVSK